MNYRDVVGEEHAEEYVRYHRALVNELFSCQFSILFLEESVLFVSDKSIFRTFWVLKGMFFHERDMLILILWKLYFDNGKDAYSLNGFIRMLLSNCKDPDTKRQLQDIINKTSWSSRKKWLTELKDSLPSVRNFTIAHSLRIDSQYFKVRQEPLRSLFDIAIDVLNSLTFRPDFYKEDETYYFDEESNRDMMAEFIRYQRLSSYEITEVSYKLKSDSFDSAIREIAQDVQKINNAIKVDTN